MCLTEMFDKWQWRLNLLLLLLLLLLLFLLFIAPFGHLISSSSSCHAISMDIPEPLLRPLPIVHCFRQVWAGLLYVGLSWLSCLCLSMWWGPQEYITYELVPTSPAVSCMSGSSNFDSFHDGWSVAIKLLLCGVLLPELVQYCLQHSCVVAIKLFLHTFS